MSTRSFAPRNGRSMRGYRPSTKPSISGVAFAADATSAAQRFDGVAATDALDDRLGFPRYEAGPRKVGWLVNMHSVRDLSFIFICFSDSLDYAATGKRRGKW